jgi:hypothetical protein
MNLCLQLFRQEVKEVKGRIGQKDEVQHPKNLRTRMEKNWFGAT